MAPLSRSAATAARTWTHHALPRASTTPLAAIPKPAASITHQQRRGKAEAKHMSFDSPFDGRGSGKQETSAYSQSRYDSINHRSGGTARSTYDVPDFSKYKSGADEITNRVFQYFMVGTFGALTAMGAKATVQGENHRFEVME